MCKDEGHDKIRHNDRALVETGWSRHAVAFHHKEDFGQKDCDWSGNGEAGARTQELRRINTRENKIESDESDDCRYRDEEDYHSFRTSWRLVSGAFQELYAWRR